MAVVTSPADQAAATARDLRRRPNADVGGTLFKLALMAGLGFAAAILVVLIGITLIDGWDVISSLGRLQDFVSRGFSQTGAENSGVWQGIVGSLQIGVISGLVAFPLGIGAAVYLVEYARDTPLTRFIEINIRNLAGVPSIVYGLLGLTIFVRNLEWFTGGKTAVAGGLTLAALVLPIVIITSTEALKAVPDSIREAAYGVGATKWETIRSHVVPSAAPGILTGTVLATARAIGEAAPILLVGASTGFISFGDQGFFERLRGNFTALPINIFSAARQPEDSWQTYAAAASVIILVVVLVINGTAIYFRNRFEKKW